MSTSSSTQQVSVKKHFSSSILLWMRTDQPRQKGMDHWKGPHSGIIASSPGLQEYRQIHLAEVNPGLWPATEGAETQIPADRKIDGVAEVTFQSALSPLKGRAQTQLAFKDEINVFRRTLLYAGAPTTSRWYEVARPAEAVGARACPVDLRPSEEPPGRVARKAEEALVAGLRGPTTTPRAAVRGARSRTKIYGTGPRAVVYLRRRDGVSGREFRQTIKKGLIPALIDTGALKELRTQTFLPWNEKTWDTPDVAHDNPRDQRFQASLILGFPDPAARTAFFHGAQAEQLSPMLASIASAIHAYDVSAALTYVKDGQILPHYQE